MILQVNASTIELLEGDITDQDTDAIVNAANEHLVLGAGVAGAIRRKGGAKIQEECNLKGGTYVGGAVITTGGNLKAKHVIHAVGPRMGEGNEDTKLRSATINSLKVASDQGLSSISFPALSTGVFGFPIDRCAKIMLEATISYLKERSKIKNVVFVLWGQPAYSVFENTLKDLTK